MRSVRSTLKCYEYSTIAEKHIELLASNDGTKAVIRVNRIELDAYDIPEGSEIVLEASSRGAAPKFCSLGLTPSLHLDRTLEIDAHLLQTTRFNLIILDPDNPIRKVAECCYLDYSEPTKNGKRSILPTRKVEDLGRRLWRLSVEDGFIIDINGAIANIDDIVGSNEFRAIALPEITKQIALKVADEQSELSPSVRQKWREVFGAVQPEAGGETIGDHEEWADEVAEKLTQIESFTDGYLVHRGGDE
jgi:hypothetical protein